MSSSVLLQFLLHGLCEWVVSLAITFWISQGWQQSPAPVLVRLVRNPSRLWVMVAFGVAPPILSLFLNPLLIQLYTSEGAAVARIPISYLLSAIYGVLVGIAASCCTAPMTAQQPFRAGPAAGVSAILIVASYLLGSLLKFQLVVHTIGGIAVALAVLLIARSMIGGEAPPATGAEPPPMPIQRPLWPALVIGFFPAAMVLAAIAEGSYSNPGPEVVKAFFVIGGIVSVVCCFTASIMLFKRHTGGAVAGGILLLLLNGFIAFFFGCCAALSNSGFR